MKFIKSVLLHFYDEDDNYYTGGTEKYDFNFYEKNLPWPLFIVFGSLPMLCDAPSFPRQCEYFICSSPMDRV